jgi:ComF family protein
MRTAEIAGLWTAARVGWRQMAERAIRRLPSQCSLCATWPAAPICADCLARWIRPRQRCATCALPLTRTDGDACCARCRRRPPALDTCVAAVDYDYPWSSCITDFKFLQHPGWARTLADLMRTAPGGAAVLSRADLVVALPLAPARLRERGYNQALLLARALAPARVEPRLLLRVRHTRPQSQLDRAGRLRNLQGAFAIEPARAHELVGRRVLLIDDVMTSGASLQEAARVLRLAGARGVDALVLARTDEA